jgi:hypothetical protein
MNGAGTDIDHLWLCIAQEAKRLRLFADWKANSTYVEGLRKAEEDCLRRRVEEYIATCRQMATQ